VVGHVHRGDPGRYAPWCGCDECWERTKVEYPGYRLVESQNDFDELYAEIEACKFLSFDYETFAVMNDHWMENFTDKQRPFDLPNTHICSAGFSTKPGTAWYLSVNHRQPSPNRRGKDVELLLDAKPEDVPLIAHNAAYEQSVSLVNLYDYKIGPWKRKFLPTPLHDTMIMAFIEDENQFVNLKGLTKKKLGFTQLSYSHVMKQCDAQDMSEITAREGLVYGCMDADQTLALYHMLRASLEKAGTWRNCILDFWMCELISTMTIGGVRLDSEELAKQTQDNAVKMAELEEKIYEEIGHEILLSSPKQVAHVLYNELGLPVTVRNEPTDAMKARGVTEGAPSTNAEALVYLRDAHPVAGLLFEYRDYEQRNKMFYQSYPKLRHPDTGCLHGQPRLTTNDDTGLSTGRMSYSQPNMQQIPKRGEKVIVRKVFIPDLGHDLIGTSDLSQIELRLLAWFSRDPELMRCYIEGIDVHTLTTSKAFDKPMEEVTKKERFVGKTLNFSIVYGAAATRIMKIVNADAKRFGVDVAITEVQALTLIANYFRAYRGVETFMRKQKEFAFQHGYVQSMFKRRFHLPHIRSRKSYFRSKAERKAVNSPIQGSAAEIIKRNAINIFRSDEYQYMERNGYARMLMMIHDEIVFSYKRDVHQELAGLVIRHQENAPKGLDVPLEAGWAFGNNFAELEEVPRADLLEWKGAA